MTLHVTPHEPRIVNPDPKYKRAELVEPSTLGYLIIAAEVQPRPTPLARNTREKDALLARLWEMARQLEELGAVERVTIFDGLVFAPPNAAARESASAAGVPRYDIVVQIETSSPATARDVRTTPACRALLETLERESRRMYVITARNAKRIADVDKSRKGVFVFNYLTGDDPALVRELWDYLAGWFVAETGLDNSVLLVPLEGERSDYVAINTARWDGSLLKFFRRQMTKKSFRTYVQANLEENHVAALPMIYRLATPPARGAMRWLPAALGGLAAVAGIALGVGIARKRRQDAARHAAARRLGMWRALAGRPAMGRFAGQRRAGWQPIAWRPVAWSPVAWRPVAWGRATRRGRRETVAR